MAWIENKQIIVLNDLCTLLIFLVALQVETKWEIALEIARVRDPSNYRFSPWLSSQGWLYYFWVVICCHCSRMQIVGKYFGVRKWIKVLAMALNQFIFSSEFRLNLRLQLFAGGFSIIDKWFTWKVFWTSEQFGKLQIDLNLSLAVYSENLCDEVKILTRYLTNRCGRSHQRLFQMTNFPNLISPHPCKSSTEEKHVYVNRNGGLS